MESVITTRIPRDLDKDLANVAKTEYLDKSTIIRKFLFISVKEWKKDQAIKLYKEEKFTAAQAAKFANLNLWDFFDELHKRKIPINYDSEDLNDDLKAIKWKRQ